MTDRPCPSPLPPRHRKRFALAFAALSSALHAVSPEASKTPVTPEATLAAPGDEISIQEVIAGLQQGWNRKDGEAFAAGLAEEHDYVAISGLYLPKVSRERNARAHQDLFDGVYAEVDIQLRLAKVRFLSPEVAVAHVQGHSHAKGKVEEKRQEIVITTVLQKRAEGWEIVAFQNTPVQSRPGSSIPPARD